MPRVLFTISYGIKPEARAAYLEHIVRMKTHFLNVARKNYAVFEVKGKKNHFMEVFTSESMEEFDALEDNLAPEAEAMVVKVEGFINHDGMKYTTLVETV
jgi:hypothetical protein